MDSFQYPDNRAAEDEPRETHPCNIMYERNKYGLAQVLCYFVAGQNLKQGRSVSTEYLTREVLKKVKVMCVIQLTFNGRLHTGPRNCRMFCMIDIIMHTTTRVCIERHTARHSSGFLLNLADSFSSSHNRSIREELSSDPSSCCDIKCSLDFSLSLSMQKKHVKCIGEIALVVRILPVISIGLLVVGHVYRL